MSLFTKQEHSLIFSGLKKSTFLKSMLLSNFLIRWSWNILNKNNISMMLNKCLMRWFWVDVTTKPRFSGSNYLFLTHEGTTFVSKERKKEKERYKNYQTNRGLLSLKIFLKIFQNSLCLLCFFDHRYSSIPVLNFLQQAA